MPGPAGRGERDEARGGGAPDTARTGKAKSLGKRRNPAKDEREQAFKRAALKVFSSKGYHRSTMAEIALEAGFGKGTLYWYWKSKEELYFALIEDMHAEFLALVEEAAAREGDAWEKLRWLAREVVDLYYRDRDYCKLSWKMRAEELETFSPEYVDRLYVYINRTKEKLQEIVSQGMEEGLIPPLDPYYLACILLGLVEGMEIQWLEDSRVRPAHGHGHRHGAVGEAGPLPGSRRRSGRQRQEGKQEDGGRKTATMTAVMDVAEGLVRPRPEDLARRRLRCPG